MALLRRAPPSIDFAVIGFSMWIFNDQFVMHAGKIIEWHPGPKQLCHYTIFLFGIFVDIVEGLSSPQSN
jgi:hypothetical protein